jgi:hypothetical protein
LSASIPDIPSQHHAALNLAKKPAHFVSGASLSDSHPAGHQVGQFVGLTAELHDEDTRV